MHFVKGVVFCLLACNAACGMPQSHAKRLDSDDSANQVSPRDDIAPAIRPRFLPLIGAAVAGIAGLFSSGTAITLGGMGLKGVFKPKGFPLGRHPFGPHAHEDFESQLQQQQTQQQTQPPQTQSQIVTEPPPHQVTQSLPTSTTPATSSSSATTPCTICIACEDEEMPESELPLADVWDPWPEEISPDPVTSLATLITTTATTTTAAEVTPAAALMKRATIRTITICGETVNVPGYTGWSELAEKRWGLKKYGYEFRKLCPRYSWELIEGGNAPAKKKYASKWRALK